MVQNVLPVSILCDKRNPPQCYFDSVVVISLNHFLQRIVRKCICPWLPVSACAEPTGIERRPLETERLQLWNGAEHLFGREIHLVSPSAPVRLVVGLGGMSEAETTLLQQLGISAQRFIEIT